MIFVQLHIPAMIVKRKRGSRKIKKRVSCFRSMFDLFRHPYRRHYAIGTANTNGQAIYIHVMTIISFAENKEKTTIPVPFILRCTRIKGGKIHRRKSSQMRAECVGCSINGSTVFPLYYAIRSIYLIRLLYFCSPLFAG